MEGTFVANRTFGIVLNRNKKRQADQSDLTSQVSKIILGCMQYGSKEPWMITDHDEGIKQLKYAYDKGVNVSSSRHFDKISKSTILSCFFSIFFGFFSFLVPTVGEFC